MMYYRWQLIDEQTVGIVNASLSRLPLPMTLTFRKVAERWCVDHCKQNRYWKVDELMWFCRTCKWWYHVECCQSAGLTANYTTLEDFLTIPLLKGGPAGVIGTAPLAFGAAHVVKKLKGKPMVEVDGWMRALEEMLQCSVDEFLNDDMKGVLDVLGTGVKCASCNDAQGSQ
jgi:hypothetical protein